MLPHRIRLRGPWEYEPLVHMVLELNGRIKRNSEHLPPPGSMTMPCRWQDGGLGNFSGRVRFRRRFGWPARIDPGERLWLTFAGAETKVEIWLNGHYLGKPDCASKPFEFEVTSILQKRNELIVEVEALAGGGLWGEVALEVRGEDSRNE